MTKSTYSSEVKSYLLERTAQETGFVKASGSKKINKCCEKAFLAGALIFSKRTDKALHALTVDSTAFSELLVYLFIHTLHAEPTVLEKKSGARTLYELILDKRAFEEISKTFLNSGDLSDFLKCNVCISYFLRGAFLACGTVTDPKISYHLEFIAPNLRAAEALFSLLLVENKEARLIERRQNHVVYIKGRERVSDLFAEMGAQTYALDIIEKSIEKEMKNALNRSCNCENANTRKTVSASVDTRAAIEKIKERGMFSSLSDELKQAAELRLLYPEASLSELCMYLENGNISRSGLNHRLRKLCEIAKELD